MASSKKGTVKYKTEALISSKEFDSYQQDFARALLPEEEYTMEEAKEILNRFFDEKKEEK
ncbi:hypothetical protein [Lacrimispora sp.]|uniref:hypothetical protein n=1 Tax=Lacrimispora sp. TaxID=2719234 RepID=UPI0028A9C41D|nr:hypothetical protein [Lacrimispora sp.]